MARMWDWVLLGGLLATACGDDGSSDDQGGRGPNGALTGTAERTSGVDESRTIAGLSASDAQALCEWTIRRSIAVNEATQDEQCALYSASRDVAACEEDVELCLDDYAQLSPRPDEAQITAAAAPCVALLALGVELGCAATIAELETCVRDDGAAYEAKFGGLSCDNANEAQLEDAKTPASCLALELKCPDWFSAEG